MIPTISEIAGRSAVTAAGANFSPESHAPAVVLNFDEEDRALEQQFALMPRFVRLSPPVHSTSAPALAAPASFASGAAFSSARIIDMNVITFRTIAASESVSNSISSVEA
jgi:hypothetical protein